MLRPFLSLALISTSLHGQAPSPSVAPPPQGVAAQSRHILFITIDGVRPEDLFGGADPVVMADPKLAGITDTAAFRARWWRDTPEERRRAVMPFVWDTLVPAGVLYGQGQNVRVTNGLNFSGPGYTELFTGAARADVTSNDDRRYSHRTLFEVVRDATSSSTGQAGEAGAPVPSAARDRPYTGVAAFTSWTTQARLTATQGGTFVSQGPFEPLPSQLQDDPRLVRLAEIESRTRHDDRTLRHDSFTHELALAWLVKFRPTLLHIGYGEPDVDAHARRYDRYLAMLHDLDRMLSELMHAVWADPALRDATTIIITTDHGRGATARDWTDHGRDVPNAARWWFLAAGAGVAPRGVVADPMTQAQTAPTILRLLGIPATGLSGAAGAVDLARR